MEKRIETLGIITLYLLNRMFYKVTNYGKNFYRSVLFLND